VQEVASTQISLSFHALGRVKKYRDLNHDAKLLRSVSILSGVN
jgi:hypothetical protein